MATVNVRRDVQDSFYRYKMPKLTAKVKDPYQKKKKKNLCTNFYLISRLKVKVMVSRQSS